MEPMNTTQHHSKVRVSLALSSPLFVAGDDITGKMEMECKADKGLGISVMMVELIATQELLSRDHSATSTFIQSKRLFQGPGLPPSNAVLAHPLPGAPPLPQNYFQARKGATTFFFNFPTPPSSPNSTNFGNGLAKVRYEVRGTVGIVWKNDRVFVRDQKEVEIAECLVESRIPKEPATLAAEAGKLWIQANVIGGIGIIGKSACVELRVKNHSAKKTTDLSLSLTRTLHLPSIGTAKNPFQLTDTLLTVPFRGSEYTIGPGVEGVANLVFDIPRNSRGVKGGTREQAEENDQRHCEALFEVKTLVHVKIGMGIGSKDLTLDVPIVILHPAAVPENMFDPYEMPHPVYSPGLGYPQFEPPRIPFAQGGNGSASNSPVPLAYSGTPPLAYGTPPVAYGTPPFDTRHYTPPLIPYYTPPPDQAYYFPPPPNPNAPFWYPPRPASAEPVASLPLVGLPVIQPRGPLPPPPTSHQTGNHPVSAPIIPPAPIVTMAAVGVGHTEEGKGERASRISLHLKNHSRNRSTSPTSHRYRVGTGLPQPHGGGELPSHPLLPNRTTSGTAGLPLRTDSIPIPLRAPELHSPRPMMSPKASFQGESQLDAIGTARSNRVEVLERMAAKAEEEEAIAKRTVSDPLSPTAIGKGKATDLPKRELDAAELNAILDKTLPGPPVPSTRSKPAIDGAAAGAKLTDLFNLGVRRSEDPSVMRDQAKVQELWAAERHEATGTARKASLLVMANLPPGRRTSSGFVVRPIVDASTEQPPTQTPTALDALEKRLAKEVGTRKPPPAMLRQLKDMDAAAMPMITEAETRSPATLSPERPFGTRAPKLEGLEPRVKPPGTSNVATVTPSRDDEGAIHALLNRKRRTSAAAADGQNDKAGTSQQEEEALRLRRMAKGRVANWLGAVSTVGADPPPPSETRISNPRSSDLPSASVDLVQALPAKVSKQVEEAKKPEPSSGTEVLVSGKPRERRATLREEQPQATPTVVKQEVVQELKNVPPKPKAIFPPLKPNTGLSPPRNNLGVSASASEPLLPSLDAKYDVRSARGGRGGKVASVAALWADKVEAVTKEGAVAKPSPLRNGAVSPSPVNVKTVPVTGVPKLGAIAETGIGKRPPIMNMKESSSSPRLPTTTTTTAVASPPPSSANKYNVNRMMKSTSSPAKLSSSVVAAPSLSTTATLSRPQIYNARGIALVSPRTALPPTIPESHTEGQVARGPTTAVDVSFGQAKLKDLIRKYQG